MKFSGDIKVIQKIEQEIKKHPHKVLKAFPVAPPIRALVEPSLITKIYRIILAPYYYDVKLTFDLRDNKGTFFMKDRDSQYLFVKVPGIPKILSEMDDIVYHFGSGLPDKKEALL